MRTSAPEFIFVTGGVVSSLRQGLASASRGAARKPRPACPMVKMDVHQHVDPGTMNPYQPAKCSSRTTARNRPRSQALRAVLLDPDGPETASPPVVYFGHQQGGAATTSAEPCR
jgi:hypothetical protein